METKLEELERRVKTLEDYAVMSARLLEKLTMLNTLLVQRVNKNEGAITTI